MSIAEARLKLELVHRALGQMREATSFEDLGAAMRTFSSAARNVRALVTQVARSGDGDRIDRGRFESWLKKATRSIDPPLPLGELHLGRELSLEYAPRPGLPVPKAALTIGRSRRDPRRANPASFTTRAVYFVHEPARPAVELCADYLSRLTAFVEDAASQASPLEDA
jgi:hypothetical protein